jgi:hypothetical protein
MNGRITFFKRKKLHKSVDTLVTKKVFFIVLSSGYLKLHSIDTIEFSYESLWANSENNMNLVVQYILWPFKSTNVIL